MAEEKSQKEQQPQAVDPSQTHGRGRSRRDRTTRPNTAPTTSRCSRASSTSARARACTSATPPPRAAPPGLRDRRQLDRRGHGRLLQERSWSRSTPTARARSSTTAAASPSAFTRRGHPDGRGGLRHPRAPAASSSTTTTRPTRSPAACTAWARRSSTALSEWLEVEVSRDGKVHHMEFERGKKSSDLKVIGKTHQDRHQGHLQARQPDLPRHRVQVRGAGQPPARAGVPERGRRRSSSRTSASGRRDDFKYEHGPDRVRQATSTTARTSLHADHLLQEGRAEQRPRASKSRCSTTTATTRRSLTFANNINNHEGGTHLSGFKTALTGTINRYAEQNRLDQGRPPDRRRRARGPDRDHQRQGPRAAVRRADQEQAAATARSKGSSQSAVNEKLARYFEENPKDAKVDLREGHAGGRGPRGGPQGPRADPPQEQPRRHAACPASSPTAAARATRTPSCSSSKATRPAAPPSRAATPTSRRSSPSAASC